MTYDFILQKAPTFSCLSYHKNITSSIFIGSEFLFSARLYANLKRHLPIVVFDIDKPDPLLLVIYFLSINCFP